MGTVRRNLKWLLGTGVWNWACPRSLRCPQTIPKYYALYLEITKHVHNVFRKGVASDIVGNSRVPQGGSTFSAMTKTPIRASVEQPIIQLRDNYKMKAAQANGHMGNTPRFLEMLEIAQRRSTQELILNKNAHTVTHGRIGDAIIYLSTKRTSSEDAQMSNRYSKESWTSTCWQWGRWKLLSQGMQMGISL